MTPKTWAQGPTASGSHIVFIEASHGFECVEKQAPRAQTDGIPVPVVSVHAKDLLQHDVCMAGVLASPLLSSSQPHVTLISAELSPRIWRQQGSQWERTLSRT